MKIGHIAYTYKPIIGGCETYISTLKELFRQERYSQRIYQVRRDGVKDKDIKLVPVLNIFKRKPLHFYNIFLNLFLFDLLQEDFLIIHDPFHFIPVSWHKRSIVISHGVRWERPQKEQNLYNLVHYWSARFAYKYAYKLVANDSDFFRKMGFDLKPKEKIFQEILPNKWFIPNCVDIKKFKKTEPIAGLKALNPILVPRNIVRGRGIHLAVSAFKEFSKIIQNTNLIICGDFSDNQYKFEILNQIKEFKLIGKVYFIGSIDWQIMPKIYSSSLMSVIPTIYEEGTSLAALESMSCGTPTVSTNIGGLADLPTVQAEPDAKDLAKKMIETFKAKRKVSNRQQEEVHNVYNMENFKKAWLEVISK